MFQVLLQGIGVFVAGGCGKKISSYPLTQTTVPVYHIVLLNSAVMIHHVIHVMDHVVKMMACGPM